VVEGIQTAEMVGLVIPNRELLIILALLVILMAGIQIGAERRNGTQEMSFALPFTRERIYWTKWMFAFALIVSSITLNEIIDAVVVINSPISYFFISNIISFSGLLRF
jgi:ABC-type transport system involved in multi-copper enzyme maturation permease subunit